MHVNGLRSDQFIRTPITNGKPIEQIQCTRRQSDLLAYCLSMKLVGVCVTSHEYLAIGRLGQYKLIHKS